MKKKNKKKKEKGEKGNSIVTDFFLSPFEKLSTGHLAVKKTIAHFDLLEELEESSSSCWKLRNLVVSSVCVSSQHFFFEREKPVDPKIAYRQDNTYTHTH